MRQMVEQKRLYTKMHYFNVMCLLSKYISINKIISFVCFLYMFEMKLSGSSRLVYIIIIIVIL